MTNADQLARRSPSSPSTVDRSTVEVIDVAPLPVPRPSTRTQQPGTTVTVRATGEVLPRTSTRTQPGTTVTVRATGEVLPTTSTTTPRVTAVETGYVGVSDGQVVATGGDARIVERATARASLAPMTSSAADGLTPAEVIDAGGGILAPAELAPVPASPIARVQAWARTPAGKAVIAGLFAVALISARKGAS